MYMQPRRPHHIPVTDVRWYMDHMFRMAHHISKTCTHRIEVVVGAMRRAMISSTQSLDMMALTKSSILVHNEFTTSN